MGLGLGLGLGLPAASHSVGSQSVTWIIAELSPRVRVKG